MNPPLAIDLFAGLGGWTEGLLAAGFRVVGFDIERHVYGDANYPAQLVLQDVLTVHGSQFKDACLIVASPPCQNYSYLAMPWSRSTDPENSKAAKALRKKWETEGPDNRLFDACFRIQEQAIYARKTTIRCGCSLGLTRESCQRCYIPLVVENVRGAVPWVGREAAKFGSFYLWGDVAQVGNRVIAGRDLADIRAGRGRFGMGVAPAESVKGFGGGWFENADTGAMNPSRNPREFLEAQKVPGFRFDGSGRSFQTASVEAAGRKQLHSRGNNQTCGKHRMGLGAQSVTRLLPETGDGGNNAVTDMGTKVGGDWFSDPNSTCLKHGSRSNARKAASALIAKIPKALGEYVGRQYYPETQNPHRGGEG